MYDKLTQACKHLPIKDVAQKPQFYDNAVEISLNVDVEIPGRDVIDRVKEGKSLDEADRLHLTYYIATMIRRVPHARERGYAAIPRALAETVSEVKDFFQRKHLAGEIDSETLAGKLAEADAAEAKFRDRPPPEVIARIETPWPFESMLFVINSMYWRILMRNGRSRFLTSDNPVHFFEWFGLGRLASEVTFPLTSDLLLHCSWQKGESMGIMPAPEKLVKEFNRRIASYADRFIFYHEQADWVYSVAKCHPTQLNRIKW